MSNLAKTIWGFLNEHAKKADANRDLGGEEKVSWLVDQARSVFGSEIEYTEAGVYDSPGYTARYYTIAYIVHNKIHFYNYTYEIW